MESRLILHLFQKYDEDFMTEMICLDVKENPHIDLYEPVKIMAFIKKEQEYLMCPIGNRFN